MKIKKSIKFIFCFAIYLMSFFNVYGITHKYITTDVIGAVSTKPRSIIKGITPAADFTVTVRAETKTAVKGQHIRLEKWKNHSSYFAVVENLRIENGGNGRSQIRFKENGDEVEDTVEFTVSGRIIFDWKNLKNNNQMIVKIGELYDKCENGNYMGDVLIDLESLDIISSLKVKVLQDMNFGTVVAGSYADTGKGIGEPAKVEVEGAEGKNVKLIIPQSTEIENSKGDTITVNLKFRDESIKEGNTQITIKNISQKGQNKQTGKTEQIIIDGSMKTKSQNMGDYKGTFTVRVEYDY